MSVEDLYHEQPNDAFSEGMDTLYMDGLSKVAQGYTTFSEVMRVAKRGDGDGVS